MSAEDVYDCPSCGAEVHDMDVKCARCETPLASTGALRMVGQLVMNQYEVIEVIGQGGMAVVYAARHELTGQEVALKVLPPEMAAHRGLQSRFVEEARALAKLDHPNIVHLYNFGSDAGCFVLAMQLVRGKTWEKLIVDGDLDWRRSVEIAVDVCRALQYAHDHDIIHRDMKPSNVLIREGDGSAMVMDFGIAKAEKSSKLTDTGQTMGTVRYMSPEQVRGKPVDPRSDIYSLGVSLYEALCGATPFEGETHYDIMNAQLKVLPPPLAERAPQVPEALTRAVHWMLAKAPDERPASAAEVEQALAAILDGAEPELPADSQVRSMPSVPPGAASPESLAQAEAVSPAASLPELAAPEGRRFPLTAALAIAVIIAGAVVAFVLMRPPPGDGGGHGGGTGTAASANRNDPGTGAAPDVNTPAPAMDAAPVAIPAGFEVAIELNYPEDNLRILAAPDVSTEGLRATYKAGVARWRAYLAERHPDWSELDRPVPLITILVGPAELVCDRAVLDGDEAYAECAGVGAYAPRDHSIRIPAGNKATETERLLHATVPIVSCGHSSRCMDEAQPYLLALYK